MGFLGATPTPIGPPNREKVSVVPGPLWLRILGAASPLVLHFSVVWSSVGRGRRVTAVVFHFGVSRCLDTALLIFVVMEKNKKGVNYCLLKALVAFPLNNARQPFRHVLRLHDQEISDVCHQVAAALPLHFLHTNIPTAHDTSVRWFLPDQRPN